MRLKALLPRTAKQFVKRHIGRALKMTYAEDGLPASLGTYFPRGSPITIIDVGAHRGEFTAAMQRRCGIRQCLLCEPIPARVLELRERFASPAFEIYPGLIAAVSGTVPFNVYRFDAASSLLPMKNGLAELGSINPLGASSIDVPCRRLDEVAPESKYPNVDLLKIDVQGAEALVIEGAKATLARTRVIWVELSFRPLYDGSALFPGIYAMLEEMRFHLHEIEPGFRAPDGELLQVDALFLRKTN